MMGEGEGEKAVDVLSRDEVIGCVSDYISVCAVWLENDGSQ